MTYSTKARGILIKPRLRTSSSILQIAMTLTVCLHIVKAESPIALFVGIRLGDSSYAKVKQISLDSLQTAYNEMAKAEINADIQEIQAKDGQKGAWQYTFEPHVTSQFIGGSLPVDPVQRDLYLGFEEDIMCIVSVPAIAYLPGNLIAGIGFTDISQIYMLNGFPHTTLFNKGMTAKYSNDLIEALSVHEQFKSDYSQQFAKAPTVSTYPVTIEGKSYEAYVIAQRPDPWRMVGYTHKFFTS